MREREEARARCFGGTHIDHADMLRWWATQRVLPFRVMAPSTLGTFLRAFTFGHVRQLDKVVGETIGRAWSARAGPAGPMTIDLDSTICFTRDPGWQGTPAPGPCSTGDRYRGPKTVEREDADGIHRGRHRRDRPHGVLAQLGAHHAGHGCGGVPGRGRRRGRRSRRRGRHDLLRGGRLGRAACGVVGDRYPRARVEHRHDGRRERRRQCDRDRRCRDRCRLVPFGARVPIAQRSLRPPVRHRDRPARRGR